MFCTKRRQGDFITVKLGDSCPCNLNLQLDVGSFTLNFG